MTDIKAGDIVEIEKDLCLLFKDKMGELSNVILVNTWNLSNSGIQGAVSGKQLESTKVICSLTDILTKIMTNE